MAFELQHQNQRIYLEIVEDVELIAGGQESPPWWMLSSPLELLILSCCPDVGDVHRALDLT